MHRKKLLESLATYKESNLITANEQTQYQELLNFVQTQRDCFKRTCKGHVTGSAWVLNQQGTHVLLTHHRKLNAWLQLGGHADGDPDIALVAMKEAEEESGIENLQLVSKTIFDIDIHPIPNTCYKHYDIRYLIKAPEGAQYIISEESIDLKWVHLDKISTYSSEKSLLRMARKTVNFR